MGKILEMLREHVFPFWRSFIIVLTPILSFPLIAFSQEARCAYVLVNMASFWVTEAIPIPVTSLIPVIAFPLLGIMSTGEVSVLYMKSTIMLFLGGLMIAIGVEHCNLHKRIALFVILHVGQSPRRLMAGFMITTMFLSMWISNTASTAMMVPIVDAIVEELFANKFNDIEMKTRGSTSNSVDDLSVAAHHQSKVELYPENVQHHSPDSDLTELQAKKREMRNMCFLAVAYSANVGGTGSLTGTGPNLVLKGLLDSSFSESTGLTFASWMGFNVPGMIICVTLVWLWLQIYFLGFRNKDRMLDTSPETIKNVRNMIERKYKELGKITVHERTVLSCFILLVFLWLFREPGFIKGWADIFKYYYGEENYKKIDDGTSAILIACILFALPAQLNFWPFKRNSGDREAAPGCLTWELVHEKIPWGIIILVGSGFAMAEASKVSGLSQWMGQQLTVLDFMPLPAMAIVISILVAMLTEITSNTAIASIFLPVLLDLSLSLKIHPIYLMMTSAVCCSYAFMLPVATPPNAIAFAAAKMSTVEMMKVGFIMNILCVLVVNVMINTLGVTMFDLNNFPEWTNSTTV